MNVLITGAGGQLGKELKLTAPDHLKINACDSKLLDITQAKQVNSIFDQIHPDVVINAAAYTAVDKAESDRDAAFAVNAYGPRNIARACKKMGSRLIHISTDFVFSGSSPLPYLPNDAPKPLGVYGKSKLEGEKAVCKETDGNALILRTAWLYSAHGNNFVKTMLNLMQVKKQVDVVYDQIGSPTWAKSLAEIIWKFAIHYPKLKGVYHFTNAGVSSWYDFAIAIHSEAVRLRLLEKRILISPIRSQKYPTLAIRPANSVLDCSKTWADININPGHWRKYLQEMLKDISL